MRIFFRSIPYFLIAVTYFLSLTIFCYILVGYLFHIFNPKEIFIDRRLFEQEYTQTLLTDAFLLGFVGWLMFYIYRHHSIKKIQLSRIEKISFLITSILTTLYFLNNAVIPRIQYWLMFLLLASVFMVMYYCLLSFYASLSADFVDLFSKHKLLFIFRFFDRLPNQKKRSKLEFQFHTTAIMISIVVTIVTSIIIIYTGTKYIKGTIILENKLRDRLYIQRIIPAKTTHAEKVVLKGFNFGWGSISDKRFTLMSTDGPINQVDKWEDNTILFIVPLHLHPGTKQIWIRKPADQLKENSKEIESNKVSIHVYSRFDFYPAQDDTFFGKVYKKIRNFIFYNTIEDTASLLK